MFLLLIIAHSTSSAMSYRRANFGLILWSRLMILSVCSRSKTQQELQEKFEPLQRTCLDNTNQLLKMMGNNLKRKKAISFIKNLLVCIATAPFLVGFVYAGAWACHHKKTHKHLLFIDSVEKSDRFIR